MEILPAELIIQEILPNLTLVDAISLRGSCKYLNWVIDDREISKILCLKLFNNLGLSKMFWRLMVNDGDYDSGKLFKYIKNIHMGKIIEFIKLSLPEFKFELRKYYGNCHYFNIGSSCYFPYGLYRCGSIILHQDGRRVVYLGEKILILQDLYDPSKSPSTIFNRCILPYYIGINENEAEVYWEWRQINDVKFNIDLLPIEYHGENQITFPIPITGNYWSLKYSSPSLHCKWNFAMEKFQRNFLPVKAIGAKSTGTFNGCLIFLAENDEIIGKNIIKVMDYDECDIISYYDEKGVEIKKLETHRKRKLIICDDTS